MPQVQNTGMNVPAILQLKLSVSVTAALYYEDIRRPIIPIIMNWARIRYFRSFTTSYEEWEDPADIPEHSKDVSIIQLLGLVTEYLRSKLGVRKFRCHMSLGLIPLCLLLVQSLQLSHNLKA